MQFGPGWCRQATGPPAAEDKLLAPEQAIQVACQKGPCLPRVRWLVDSGPPGWPFADAGLCGAGFRGLPRWWRRAEMPAARRGGTAQSPCGTWPTGWGTTQRPITGTMGSGRMRQGNMHHLRGWPGGSAATGPLCKEVSSRYPQSLRMTLFAWASLLPQNRLVVVGMLGWRSTNAQGISALAFLNRELAISWQSCFPASQIYFMK